MAEQPKILNIQDLGAGEIQKKLQAGADTILIPIGSCERHGNPYTPLGLDGLVTFGVVQRASEKAEVLHTPLMPFGYNRTTWDRSRKDVARSACGSKPIAVYWKTSAAA